MVLYKAVPLYRVAVNHCLGIYGMLCSIVFLVSLKINVEIGVRGGLITPAFSLIYTKFESVFSAAV